ncbi:MAG TPA: hypothetical protein DD713_03760 [Nitrospiraceae bacterium]|nr:hypothetical protein [Nitrospiraceae bacterium]
MEIGIAIAIDRLISTVKEFKPADVLEIQMTNAEMIRECAAVIANAAEEQIIDALKEEKKHIE